MLTDTNVEIVNCVYEEQYVFEVDSEMCYISWIVFFSESLLYPIQPNKGENE